MHGDRTETRTSPRPFVFILMPFSAAFDDAYQLAIKPACESAGAYAERVDEQVFEGSILDRVYNQIAKADIVVADLTGHSPNVFYETGYAHALGKLTILLTSSADDIPFDLQHYPHIVYGGKLGTLRAELEKRVRWHLANPTKVSPDENLLSARANNVPLVDGAVVEIPVQPYRHDVELRFALHNAVGREFRSVDLRVGLFTPIGFSQFSEHTPQGGQRCSVVEFSDEATLHLPRSTVSLLPAGWETLHLALMEGQVDLTPGSSYTFTLRLFTASGFRDFPFDVRFTEP